MSLKAYEDACARAELFGHPMPEKNEFLEKHKHLDIVEFEEVDIQNAEGTAMLTENLHTASGQFTELNSILASTHHKINKLKGVCGSLTNFFRAKVTAKDNLSYSSDPSYVGQGQGSAQSTSGLGPDDRELAGADTDTDLTNQEKIDQTKTQMCSNVKAMKGQAGKMDAMLQQADKTQTSFTSFKKDMSALAKR